MDNNKAIRKWSEMNRLAVFVPREGKTVGTVEDFFFKVDTNAVYALRVRTRVNGDLALPVTAIKTIGTDTLTIDNEQMLLRALPPLPSGQSLRGRKVVSEDGAEAGTIGEVTLNTNPPVTLHIAGFELAGARPGHEKSFTADAVVRYEQDAVVIHDRIARRLR